jgi:signal transduction histidine kinase
MASAIVSTSSRRAANARIGASNSPITHQVGRIARTRPLKEKRSMETTGEAPLTPSPRLVETIARTLRHEVGDLLQMVYSTVDILQARLPRDQNLECGLLADLRTRAETCKQELDAVHDILCPLSLNLGPVDLAEMVAVLVGTFTTRFPALQVRHESPGRLPTVGDARRLAQAGTLLMLSACQAAQQKVQVRTAAGPGPGEVEWSIKDDGFGASDEQIGWLAAPFSTTRNAQAGLALALTRRVAALHGGRITAENASEGGFRVRIILPTSPPQT